MEAPSRSRVVLAELPRLPFETSVDLAGSTMAKHLAESTASPASGVCVAASPQARARGAPVAPLEAASSTGCTADRGLLRLAVLFVTRQKSAVRLWILVARRVRRRPPHSEGRCSASGRCRLARHHKAARPRQALP